MTAAPPTAVLRSFEPFERLPAELSAVLDPLLEPCRFRLGQTVLVPDVLPAGVLLISRGQLRSLAPAPRGQGLRTIERLGPGCLAGWVGLLRQQPCEHLRATTEVEALLLPAATFLDLLAGHPALAAAFQQRPAAAELHSLLLSLAPHHSWALEQLEAWPEPLTGCAVRSLAPGPESSLALPPGYRWFRSSGGGAGGGSGRGGAAAEPWPEPPPSLEPLPVGSAWLRLLGFPLPPEPDGPQPDSTTATSVAAEVLGSDEYSPSPEPPAPRQAGEQASLHLQPASGPRAIPLAVVRALADYFGLPFNRDSVLNQIDAILQRQAQLNLVNLGQILDSLGLKVLLTQVPNDRLPRVPVPALLEINGRFGILDGVEPNGTARVLEAELGPLELPSSELITHEGGITELILLERKADAKERRFSWGWYLPYLSEHRRALLEVGITSLVANVLRLVPALAIMVLIQQVVSSRSMGALLSISAVMVLASLVEGVLKTLRSFIFTETANRIDQATKSTVLDQLVRLPQGFFDSRPVGTVMFYLMQLDRLREFLLGQTVTTLIDLLFSFIFLLVLLLISPLLTLVTLSTLPLLLILGVITTPIVREQISRSIGASVRTYSHLNESITGIQTIKSQNAELKTRWEFQNRYSAFIGEDFKLKITQETVKNLSEFIGRFNEVLVTGVGVWMIIENKINVGEFFAFRILAGQLTGPLVQLVSLWQSFQFTSQQLQMVADVVDRPTEQTLSEAQNIPMPPLRGHVVFRDVTFRFNEGTPLILQGVNLEIPTGSFVGLVGGSGSGKSTLLKLLPRFYRPLEGSVLIDGLDINKVELYSLRRQIGVVPQDSVLFDGTIRDNLLLVKPDASADEMIRAARVACAHDFIMALPQGYNSSVGERGAGLSGGQRQRLALARAVLQNPRMLILDEATSALDASTERQVCINLFEAFRGRTVFFITHRLTTVKPADIIVLMDSGAVMEMGSHSQLMALQGWYYALYQSQNREGVG
jgi:ATP-binding cassette, subfamily B, bacterial HlyB/CyaB